MIVNTLELPAQPLFVGVTFIVAVTGAVPLFDAVNAAISPVPFAPKPIEGVLFVQL